MNLINGVPRDQYGVWCRHGRHILVVDPADQGAYPACIPAEPWPCDTEGCTLESYERDMQAEADAYEEERWAEYHDDIRAGLAFQPMRDFHGDVS